MNGALAREVLSFWFGPDDVARDLWFRRSDAFDAEIKARFGAAVHAELTSSDVRATAAPRPGGDDAALARVLLLDQFTRNIHRGTPLAFAGDAQALALARTIVAQGVDRRWPPLRRWFAYMPFEHAEDLAAQDEAVRLFTILCDEAGRHREACAYALDYAERHRAVIRRFGRFPHRNEILGRASTPEEVAFLQEPGSRF